MTIVNFIGAPGCGKSTLALGLCSFMKVNGYNAEYVPEYIKTKIAKYGSDNTRIFDQLEIITNQNALIKDYYKNCDYVVTDGALINSVVYAQYTQDMQLRSANKDIVNLCWTLWDWYKNQYNILVQPCQNEELYKDSLRNYGFKDSLEIYNTFSLLMVYDKVLPSQIGAAPNDKVRYRQLMLDIVYNNDK